MRSFVMLALSLVAASVSAATDTPKIAESIIVQSDAEKFDGSQFRTAVNEGSSLKLGTAASWQKLQPALTFCTAKQDSEAVDYVSVSSRQELAEYIGSRPAKPTIVAIDIVCPRAFVAAAFLSIREGDSGKASHFLDLAQAIAPYWPNAYTERAFLLNTAGDRVNALIAYRRALELAEKHPGSEPVKAMALRGIGWTLVEMDDFAGAIRAYQDSLLVEPSNLIAKRELAYIADLQAKRGAAPDSGAFSAKSAGPALSGDPEQFVRYTRFLESRPLDDEARSMRQWLLGWITKSKDVGVVVCDLLGPIPGTELAYGPELLMQMIYSNAAFQIENPTRINDVLSVQVAGVIGALKAYAAILASHPEVRHPYFDELLAHYIAGDLKEFMTPLVTEKCSEKPETGNAKAMR